MRLSLRSSLVLPAAVAIGFLSAPPTVLGQNEPPPAPTAVAPALLPAGPDGAREIARQMDDFITLLIAPKQTGARFEWKDGAPTVTPGDGFYDIATPPLLLHSTPDVTLEIGPATFRGTPQPDGTMALSGTPPRRLVMKAKEQTDGVVVADQVAFSGLWSPTYATLLNADLVVSAIHATFPGADTTTELAGLTLKQSLARERGDLFTGSGTWTLNGLTIRDKDAKGSASLASAVVESAVTRLDLGRLVAARRQTAALPVDQLTPERLFPLFSGLVAGLSTRIAIDAARLTVPDETPDFALRSFAVNSSVDGVDTDTATLRLSFDLREPKGPFPPDVAPLVPSTASVVFGARKVPTDLVQRIVAIPGGMDSPMVPMVLLEAAQRSGSEITLDSLNADAPTAGIEAKGSLTFTDTAKQGALGALTVTMRGIDRLIALLKSGDGERHPVKKKGKKDAAPADDTVAFLTVLQMMGQAGKDEQGRELRSFHFELAPDGTIKLNGADISSLIGATTPHEGSDDEDAAPRVKTKKHATPD